MMQPHAASRENTDEQSILIVEDDPAIGEWLLIALDLGTPYHPVLVSRGQEALRTAPAVRPAVFLLNYQLPDMTGIELYEQLHARKELAAVPAVLMSANLPSHELNKRSLPELEKPFDLDNLLETIGQAIADSPP